MMRYIKLMKNKKQAEKPIRETLPDFKWGLGILDNLESWRKGFAEQL